jgi:DNA-binding FrmR family transcriptional regulator
MPQEGRHAIEARLARIEGHVHAVHTMTHEGRSYHEVVHQIAAVRSSLDAVVLAIVEELAESCVRASGSRTAIVPAVEELREVIASAL